MGGGNYFGAQDSSGVPCVSKRVEEVDGGKTEFRRKKEEGEIKVP